MSKKKTKIPFAAALCLAGSFLSTETHRISPDRYYTTLSGRTRPLVVS